MNEEMIMERTRHNLFRHLEDLNDEIDSNGGRIGNHMVLDGIKDVLKSIRCLKELSDGQEPVKAAV